MNEQPRGGDVGCGICHCIALQVRWSTQVAPPRTPTTSPQPHLCSYPNSRLVWREQCSQRPWRPLVKHPLSKMSDTDSKSDVTSQNGEIPLWEEGQTGAVLPGPWRRWDWIWVLKWLRGWHKQSGRCRGWGADLALRDNHQLSSAGNQADIWKILFKSKTSATRRRKLPSQQQLCQNKEGDVRPQGRSPHDFPRTSLSTWSGFTKKQM